MIEAKYMEIDGVGYAVFETDHFSYYTVSKMTPAQRCEKYGHNDSVTVVAPTCLSGGYTVSVCRRCGRTEVTNRTAALGHDWQLDQTTYAEGSCTVDGYAKYACSHCHVSYVVTSHAPGHKWTQDQENSHAATCQSAGANVFCCDHCDETYTVTIPQLKHTYETVVTEPTCTTAGYTTYTCSVCAHSYVSDHTPAGHTVVDEVHAPTCLEKGYTSHYCSVCGETFANTDEVAKAEHTWNMDAPDCEHDRVCIYCNTRHENGKATGHSMKDGYCEKCHKSCEHDYVYSRDVAPTCTSVGYKVYVCSVCQGIDKRDEVAMTAHSYKHFSDTVATCQQPAYSVEVCETCGKQQKTRVGDPIAHNYVDGVCTYCGISTSTIYLNLLKNWEGVDGLSLKIENFSYKFEEKMGDGTWSLVGSITQIDLAELMLSVDDNGDIQGAAHGAITILNGPVEGEATYALKAMIEDGTVYMLIDYKVGENTKQICQTASVDWVLSTIMDEMLDMDAEDAAVLGEFLNDDIMPVLNMLVNSNAGEINSTLGNLIDLAFTAQTANGTTVYTLDYTKLAALNEKLATLKVSELINECFGAGSFDKLKLFAVKVLDTKISELPALIDSYGVPSEDVFAAINSYAIKSGAPEDFDITDALNDPEYADFTVGYMMFGTESYNEQVAQVVEMLTTTSLYQLMAGEDAEEVKEMVSGVLDMIKENIAFSFSADAAGNTTAITVHLNDFVVEDGDRITVSFDITLVPNGEIEVTWSDIVTTVKNNIQLPTGEDRTEDGYSNSYNENGMMDYNGTEYSYYGTSYYYYRYQYYASDIVAVTLSPDCTNWVELVMQYNCAREEARYSVRILYASGILEDSKDESGTTVSAPAYYLIVNELTDEIVEYTMSEDGKTISFTRPDGSKGSFDASEVEDPSEIFEAVFGEFYWEEQYSYTTSDRIYQNTSTGETAEQSQHQYQLDESASYEPESCSQDGYKHYVCTVCGDSYGYSYNDVAHDYEIDEAQSYIPEGCKQEGYYVYVCSDCGRSYKSHFYQEHKYEDRYALADGATSCEDGVIHSRVCANCGEVAYEETMYGHSYHIEYTHEDGKIYASRECKACAGETYSHALFCELDTELNVVFHQILDEKYDNARVQFAFTPAESGWYQFYSTSDDYCQVSASLLDAHGNYYGGSSGNLSNGNFGFYYELTAGETYYLTLYTYSEKAVTPIKLHVEPIEVTTVDLATYGCGCGGYMTVASIDGKLDVKMNTDCDMTWSDGYQYCRNCGFGYMYGYQDTTGENCAQLRTLTYCFYHIDDPTAQTEYVVGTYKTGYYNHNTTWESSSETTETTDEEGNVIHVETYTEISTCVNCQKVVDKWIRISYYNQNYDLIRRNESAYGWSEELSELVLDSTCETVYTILTDANGNTFRKTVSELNNYYNSLGEISSWSKYEYTYGENICYVTKVFTDSNGKSETESYYNHSYTKSESKTETTESIDENGNVIYTATTIYTENCTSCGAAVYKSESAVTRDANGNLLGEEYRYYDLKNGEFVLSRKRVNEYDVYEYETGKFVTYLISEMNYYYNDLGEISSSDGYRNVYSDGDYCHYTRVYIYSNGEEKPDGSVRENHLLMTDLYTLHEGATSCEQGLDYSYACACCGYVEYTEENVKFEHVFESEYTYTENTVFVNTSCSVCGLKTVENKKHFKVESEEDIEHCPPLNEDAEYVWFKLTPGTTGWYEIYSYGNYTQDPYIRIYDAALSQLFSDDDGAQGYNFGVVCELTAGETYYLAIRRAADTTVFVGLQEREEIDLAAYGCTCNGKLVIATQFGEKTSFVESDCEMTWADNYQYCTKCGFAYRTQNSYTADENCNEIVTVVYNFFNVNDMENVTEYTAYSRKTGYANHSTRYESSKTSEEGVDANGNPIIITTYTEWQTCETCGHITYKWINTMHQDALGNRVYESETCYDWSAELSEIVLGYRSEATYIILTDAQGNTYAKESSYTSTEYDELGEVSYWEKTEYVYISLCEITRTYTDSKGSSETETYFEHSVYGKELPDETATDENGNTVLTKTTEDYCSICGAPISKSVNVTTTDANGNVVKEEHYDYVYYVNSDTDNGYRLQTEYVAEYGAHQLANGKYVTYVLSTFSVSYDENGETSRYRKYRYEYTDGNYCTYTLYRIYEDGTETAWNSQTNHLASHYVYKLHEGAESCTDGLDYYYVCDCCGYESLSSENYSHSHRKDTSTEERIEVDATCGGYVLVYTCPCGEMTYVELNLECDFDSSDYTYTWEGEDTRYGYYKYISGCAVTDPACGFTYSFESWYVLDENCHRINHVVYVFGVGTENEKTVAYSYDSGTVSHSYQNVTQSEETTEGDLTVTTAVTERVCQTCGHVSETRTTKTYADADGTLVKSSNTRLYYQESGDRVLSRMTYTETAMLVFGDISRKATTHQKYVYYDENGIETSWNETVYDYSSCYYTPTQTYRDSNGNEKVTQGTHGYYDYSFSHWVVEPTCTSGGTECRVCSYCGATENFEVGSYGHYYYFESWKTEPTCTQHGVAIEKCSSCSDTREQTYSCNGHSYAYDSETGIYTCGSCGLENFTGYDGSVWMEDLTEKLGGNENYVVGYYFAGDRFSYLVTVSLIVGEDQEPIILDIEATDDGSSLITVSAAAIEEAIAAQSITDTSNVMVRVNIVPQNGDTSFEYAVTMDLIGATANS